MSLKVCVLIASISQVIAAIYLSGATFQDTERIFPVFIQPADWAFSIWGLIYTLSIVYGVYQIIPKHDNALLRATRKPALVGFVGSGVWLYFAGMSNALVWLTIPTLFAMAFAFTRVVNTEGIGNNMTTNFSKNILLPYAAWTGTACWINIQAILVEKNIITNVSTNNISNAILFVGIVSFTLYYFHKTKYSIWYGGVILWASIGVISANISEGSMVFAGAAGLCALVVFWMMIKNTSY